MATVESPRSTLSPGGDDWPALAADTIVRVVGQVRDKTTGPAITASRAVVYGTLAAILATAALVVLSILVLRLAVIEVTNLLGVLDIERAGRGVWIAEVLLGVVFTGVGLGCWKKAWAPSRTA